MSDKPESASVVPSDAVADSSHSVTLMVEELRESERSKRNQAADRLWKRYGPCVLEMARRHLPPRVRLREDEHDVAQEMYADFCRRMGEGAYELADRKQLWTLLSRMTQNKASHAKARHTAKRRDFARERQATGADNGECAPVSPVDLLRDRGSSPEDEAAFVERVDTLLAGLETSLRRIACLKLQGFTNEEIADLDKCSVRTVERKLKLIRRCWREARLELSV